MMTQKELTARDAANVLETVLLPEELRTAIRTPLGEIVKSFPSTVFPVVTFDHDDLDSQSYVMRCYMEGDRHPDGSAADRPNLELQVSYYYGVLTPRIMVSFDLYRNVIEWPTFSLRQWKPAPEGMPSSVRYDFTGTRIAPCWNTVRTLFANHFGFDTMTASIERVTDTVRALAWGDALWQGHCEFCLNMSQPRMRAEWRRYLGHPENVPTPSMWVDLTTAGRACLVLGYHCPRV